MSETPAPLAESRDRILNSTNPFIKEEDEDDSHPNVQPTSTVHICETREDNHAEAIEPDTVGLELALDTLTKLPADSELAIPLATFIAKQKLIGTSFASRPLQQIKSTAKWVETELLGKNVVFDRRTAFAEITRHAEATVVASWIRSAFDDADTVRHVAALLSQDDVRVGVEHTKTPTIKRARESKEAAVLSDNQRGKRPRMEATSADRNLDALMLQHDRSLDEDVQFDAQANDLEHRQASSFIDHANANGDVAHQGQHQRPAATIGGSYDLSCTKANALGATSSKALANQHGPSAAAHQFQLQHTIVPFHPLRPAKFSSLLYIPINTPEMPIVSPSVAEVEAACRRLVGDPGRFCWVRRVDERFWVACWKLPKKTQQNAMEGRVLSLGRLKCQFEQLPKAAPKNFIVDLSDIMTVASADVMRSLRASLRGKCPLPTVFEILPREKKERRVFHVYFNKPPGFLRVYAPVPVQGHSTTAMVILAHRKPGHCEFCLFRHKKGDVCPAGKELAWPEDLGE